MRRKNSDLIIFKYSVDWKIFDEVGNLLDSNSKIFETKDKAKAFVQELKRRTDKRNNLQVVIRELESNEIVRRYKKAPHKKNYKRQ